jgi:hypothetical protein
VHPALARILPQSVLVSEHHHMTRRYSLGKRSKVSAAVVLRQGGGSNWVPPDEVRARLQERDAREVADTRTEAEKWLGDPPAHRSALTKTRRANAPSPRDRIRAARDIAGI